MKTWDPGAKRDWLMLGLFLGAFMAFGYLAGVVVAHWPALSLWLTSKAPWWFLPAVGFVGIALVVLTAAWRDLFPRDRA